MGVALVPRPRALELRPGSLTLRAPLRVALEREWTSVVETFTSDLAASIGWDVQVVDAAASPDLVIRVADELAPEAYRLAIDDHVTIDASAAAGAAYALTVLRQLGRTSCGPPARRSTRSNSLVS